MFRNFLIMKTSKALALIDKWIAKQEREIEKLEQMDKDVLVRQISFAKGYKWALHDVKSIVGMINNEEDGTKI